ncbi:gliding motility-associated ABC transporter permease subunit GldF [Pontibacter sp. G13]|uniref:gliding motility-associated ABC transporter permease subunit GldF n=1 Tax=Pontibacter sp. G13 TaxID=3074898 RepID=UPI00288BC996|nr:gliding motility-associated ABC transporter permease subunit GldF [Pontibacter sp. G13]WNJ16505.1 gliding motility-associated ABC transporter permease subunit GldF [Pontibacter sp. G13]
MGSIITIFRKEVASFFNSLIGYLVISVFLTGVGLFFWVFEYNVLETGLANMDALFEFGPYLFLFLVPAITMRAFSEEFKTGTIEFMATKPVTQWQIILGKYLAAVFLVFFSLLPTLLYYFTVYWLGNPVGNLDTGAIMGAYMGLFFLGSMFAGIGIFTSALSDNQIISFVLGVFLCFLFFVGFDYMAGIKELNTVNLFFLKLGILDHYRSISRGVVDTRDLMYFLSFIATTLVATKIVLIRKMG